MFFIDLNFYLHKVDFISEVSNSNIIHHFFFFSGKKNIYEIKDQGDFQPQRLRNELPILCLSTALPANNLMKLRIKMEKLEYEKNYS